MNEIQWGEGVQKKAQEYSFYDHTHIIRHLEEQAQAGWLLVDITKWWGKWVYQAIAPQKLHFAIRYAPDDAAPPASWHLAVENKEMRIFYSTDDVPEPLVIDAAQEVQAVHKRSLHSWLWSDGLAVLWELILLGMMWGYIWQKSLRPVDMLNIFGMVPCVMLHFLLAYQMLYFFAEGVRMHNWYAHARSAAEQGIFLEVADTARWNRWRYAVFDVWLIGCVIFIYVGMPLLIDGI